MIITLKDRNHLVYAYVEWNVVDDTGRTVKDGPNIYINNMWIHRSYRGSSAFQKLCERVYEHPYSQNSKWVYWVIVRGELGQKTLDENPYLEGERRMTDRFDKHKLMEIIKKGAIKWL